MKQGTGGRKAGAGVRSSAAVARAFILVALGIACLPARARGEARGSEASLPVESGVSELSELLAAPAVDVDVTVAWCDAEGRLPLGFEELSRLVSDLFLGAGVHVGWREGCVSPGFVSPGKIEVPVVLLARDRGPRRGRRNTLGATWRGSAPRPVWIYLDAIWWTLGRGALPRQIDEGEGRWLALPLARVVAHELTHALAPEQDHAERGLMKEAFSRADLLEPLTRVDAPHLALLLHGLAPLARRSERRPTEAVPSL